MKTLLGIMLVAVNCISCSRSTDRTKFASQYKDSQQVVVSYHPLATEIGERILSAGGNAFDAFVATTLAQYVLSEGVTSLAGPLGALIYDAKSQQVVYLDAGFNSPLDSSGRFDPNNPDATAGAAAFVPGAPAGLEAISQRFGSLPFAKVVEPAIELARNGFPITDLMTRSIGLYSAALKRSEYGRSTYLGSGNPLVAGQWLKLPVLAQTLEEIANHGSSYMYSGAWASDAVAQVRAKGGKLTLLDFGRYQAEWKPALAIDYRGTRIYAPSGKSYGGLTTLLALKALENAPLGGAHFSQDGDVLEKVVRAEDWAEAFTQAYSSWNRGMLLDDRDYIQSQIDLDARIIWEKVERHLSPSGGASGGTHSYQVVVMDRFGNAITGTNTIESLPWAQGIFVEGIPLTDSGMLGDQTSPGERNLMPFSMHIGMKGSRVGFAVGAFGASLIPAELQYVLNAADYGMSAADATSSPRFGIEGIDLGTFKPTGKGRWLDRRIAGSVVAQASALGLKLDQDGIAINGHQHYMDLGLGSIGIRRDDGTIDSAIAPLSVDPN